MAQRGALLGESRASARTTASLDRWLLLGGLVGPVQFVGTFMLLGAVRPGYSPLKEAISALGVGDNDWVLNGSLVLLGELLIGFAAGFYRVARPEASPWLRGACAFLLGAVGLGYFIAGTFPQTIPIHWVVGAPLVFFGAPIAFFLAALVLRGDPAWRGWPAWCLATGVLTLALVPITFYTFNPETPTELQLGGLMERVVFFVILTWFEVAGWALFRRVRAARSLAR